MRTTLNLRLPKKGRPKGLYLFCTKCKRKYSDETKVKCKCISLVYKALVHVPGTQHSVKTQTLKTENFNDAVYQFNEFRQRLNSNGFQRIYLRRQNDDLPVRLVDCFAWYMGFLNNVGVPSHKQKIREPLHIRKVDYAFELFLEALRLNDIDTKILKFSEVNDDMVGFFHDHLVTRMNYANKTYNNTMDLMKTFTSHIISKFKLDCENPFLGINRLLVIPKIVSVQESEFERLLNIVTPENGIHTKVVAGRKFPKKTQLYKPWLKYAFRLGLYTGGRSEDIVQLKWNDIIYKDGVLDTIRTVDYKIDNANNNTRGKQERYFKYFAVTRELAALLDEMGHERYQGTDCYILATEENLKRTNVGEIISRAFSHYYAQLDTGKQVTFRNLRKTFMTSALLNFGEASTALTNHTKISTTDKHYFDKEVAREQAKHSFSVFTKS